MCDPVSIGLGVATAVVGGVQTIASYQQQNAAADFADTQAFNQYMAANRAAEQQTLFAQNQAFYSMKQQNAQINIANQKQLNEWILSSNQTNLANARTQREYLMAKQQNDFTNMNNQLQFQAQLNQSILSELRAETQKGFNRLNLNADLEAAQERRNQAQAQRAFEAERLMASSLVAQGTILSSGRSGQSVGLGVLNEGAKYGRDMRMAERNLDTAMSDFYSQTTNAFIGKAQADAEAIASILPRPVEPISLPEIAPPVFAEYAPDPVFADFMTDPGPLQGTSYGAMPTPSPRASQLGLVAGIGSSILGGVSAGMSANSLIKKPPTPTPQVIYVT